MERAVTVIPGGVNSPVRSFAAVGGSPPFISGAEGAWVVDADGRRLLDFVLAYGPLILGHRHQRVQRAIELQLSRGDAYGSPTEAEVLLAERICRSFPSIEMVRLVNSGTEAAMSAIRLARASTGRDLVVKFAGCYHGHSDAVLAAAGSGVATHAVPGSPGVPAGTVADTVVLPFNDERAVTEFFAQSGKRVAALIVEPVPGNMGVVLPRPGYLELLRRLSADAGALLIFDEVITGFRLGPAGAQGLFGIRPDLTCLGKVIGGGMPVGAFGGSRALMSQLAPVGPVYQAGTLSGNPLAVAAGLAALEELDSPDCYPRLERLAASAEEGIVAVARSRGEAVAVNRMGSMLTVYFGVAQVEDFDQAAGADRSRFAQVHRRLLARGIFWPPSQFEAAFLSLAHTPADLEWLLEAFAAALAGSA